MAKTNAPRVEKNEARAFAKHIRTSPRKMNLVAALIRGKNVAEALRALDFCKRRVANEVKAVLNSAIANAENNHNLNVDKLIVSEAFVGKSIVMKRFRARAKGRGARILKPFSNLTIVVKEVEEKK
ncbi:MAG: 50S ribosomal protein L22 [Alphaproteobacteria bacterium]|jgi:large subunit ribosomal protein L22|nr:50S ribosomal protein L22 [Alphaproteobacteria bacterium]